MYTHKIVTNSDEYVSLCVYLWINMYPYMYTHKIVTNSDEFVSLWMNVDLYVYTHTQH